MIKEPEFIAFAEYSIVMNLFEAKTAITGSM
jgi:hypothetical protein